MYFLSEKLPFDHEKECVYESKFTPKKDPNSRLLRAGGKNIKHIQNIDGTLYIDPNSDFEAHVAESNFYLIQVCIKMILITQSFIKIMFFVRIFRNIGFMVQMVGSTILDIIPFLIFIMMFILYFALISIITEIDWDPAGSNYPDLQKSTIAMLQTYRNSIGDIEVPNYQFWLNRFLINVTEANNTHRDGPDHKHYHEP